MHRTVVIVDDHARFRRSARKLLELEGFDVVGEAADAASAVSEVEELRPDIVLVDIGLPDANGFELASRLSDVSDVILVSSRDHVDVAPRTRSSGALGFVPKDELSGERLAELLEGRT
jgi:two-component system response regulator EvgA